MGPNSYIIGDIHGKKGLLHRLIHRMPVKKGDRLVFLGDYIDRGSNSQGVVELILGLMEDFQVVPLMGNHEQWFLETMNDHSRNGWLLSMDGLTTIHSYSLEAALTIESEMRRPGERSRRKASYSYGEFFKAMPRAHVDFFRGLKPYFTTEGFIAAHAGLTMGLPIESADAESLFWTEFSVLKKHWIGPEKLIVGHTPTYLIDEKLKGKPYLGRNLIVIDTGAEVTGVLTAIRLPDLRIFRT